MSKISIFFLVISLTGIDLTWSFFIWFLFKFNSLGVFAGGPGFCETAVKLTSPLFLETSLELEAKVDESKKKLEDLFKESKANNLSSAELTNQFNTLYNDFVDSSTQMISKLAEKIESVLGLDKNIVMQAIVTFKSDSPSLNCIFDYLSNAVTENIDKQRELTGYFNMLKVHYENWRWTFIS